MGSLEFAAFLVGSVLRLGTAGWALGAIFFDGVEKSVVTILQVLAIYLFAELVISGAHNYVRYKAVLAQSKLRRAAKEAEERARKEALLQFKAAQSQASEKYFDARDMVLSQGAKKA